MRRLMFACMLSMLFFVQCKPEDDLDVMEEQSNSREVMISGEIRLPKSRLTMDWKGRFEWGKDYLYILNVKPNNLTRLQKGAIFPQTPEKLGFMGYSSIVANTDYILRDIYYVGGGVEVTNRYIENSVNNQSGSLSSISNHLMSKMTTIFDYRGVNGYRFPETKMIMYTSVIYIKFPNCDCESFYIDYEGCSNYYKVVPGDQYIMPYPDDTTKYIDILETTETFTYDKVSVSKNANYAYIVLYPQQEPIPNTVMTIYADETVIGTLLFPNGIRSNKLYVGENGDAIVLNARSKVVEEDLFVQDE